MESRDPGFRGHIGESGNPARTDSQSFNRTQNRPGGRMYGRRPRPVPRPTPPGQRPDAELIEEFIRTKGVTKCAPGYAMGSLRMTMLGFE